MSKTEVSTTWIKMASNVLETAKFVRAGTKIDVIPSVVPMETTVEGRYGKRKMFVINTENYGYIYVTGLQLVKVAEALQKHDFKEVVTVEI